MTKYKNPFCTFEEAVAVLKHLGAKPTANPFVYDETEIHWQDHILSVNVCRDYTTPCEYHFEVDVHVDYEGFEALAKLTGLIASREHHSDGFDALKLRPGSLLTVMTLVSKGATLS